MHLTKTDDSRLYHKESQMLRQTDFAAETILSPLRIRAWENGLRQKFFITFNLKK